MNKQLTILLIGRIITNFADSFYMIATIWYVKNFTDSTLLVGITSAIGILPVTLQFLYGPIIDRFSKQRILYFSVIGQALLVGMISILYFFDAIWIPLLLFLMYVALSFSEITYPTESALIERLTKRENLTKVNSIFAFSYQSLDLICNAISGLLITFIGLGFIYLSNSMMLFLTGLIFLFYLKVPRSDKESEPVSSGFFEQYKKDFIEGYRIVRKQKILLNILFGIIGINFMATMGIAMLPIISNNAAEYGFWLTAMSAGTLIGTSLSSKLENIPLNRLIPMISLLSGASWIFSTIFNEQFLISYVLFGLAWAGIGVLSVFIYTLIQVNLPKDYIGSGFAFLTSLLGSLSPIGYLLGGVLGELTSEYAILLIAGTGYLLFTVYFLSNPLLNKINHGLLVQLEKSNS
ncbi:MFS transporter [Chengkuizengella sp. SCS-71B]|uniref:MFS transporter n=1 Tax=Chengkuizengella sp. SCS-71B TaxID=3115290 RepID=UPI0032C223EB